jgi:hypothetical protein
MVLGLAKKRKKRKMDKIHRRDEGKRRKPSSCSG